VMPNTAIGRLPLRVVRGPALTWLAPERGECVRGRTRLLALASSTARIRAVRFFDGGQRIGTDRRGPEGLYAVTWQTRGEPRGRHRLRAVVVDAKGRQYTVARRVRVCR
jgi:hypothetical protein